MAVTPRKEPHVNEEEPGDACPHNKRGMMDALRGPKGLFLALVFLTLVSTKLGAKTKNNLITEVDDVKDFKKILRTKTNVLVIFVKSEKSVSQYMALLKEVAEEIKGKATLLLVDCGEAKKLCKKYKAAPSSVEFKHYKDGDFNKDYDRKIQKKPMVNFLLDPTGDIPWEEENTAQDVVHIDSAQSFHKLLKKEKLPLLVMFYAPWCGFCKRLKPDFAAAATEVKGEAVLVGVDVDKPHQYPLRAEYNITGFPTIYYFEKGQIKMKYGGENNKEGIVTWLKDPTQVVEPKKEEEWSDEESDVVHLTDETFDEHLQSNPSVLIMFYAPWCGHCKKMKPEYVTAAAELKEAGIEGTLAAMDSTKHKAGEKFEVKGFPTVKYFKDGEFLYNFNERTADKLVEFMKDPKEPPPPPPPEPSWEEAESDVYHLTDDNFKTFLKKKKHSLVMFYAPWCGHCKKAKPEFTQAASAYKEDTKVAFAAVDCTTQSGVCSTHEVTGYPTFKYFNYGKNPKNYMGGREENDFVNFMKDPLSSGPSPTPSPPSRNAEDDWSDIEGASNVNILTTANFDSFVAEQKSVLVMFYAPWCGHCKSMKPDYSKAATTMKTEGISGALAAVDATLEEALGTKYNVRGYPTLKYFKDGAEAFDYSAGRKADDFVAFMKSPKAPPPPPPAEPEWSEEKTDVHFLTTETFKTFITKHKSVLVMFYAPWCGHCKRIKPEYISAAAILAKELPGGKLAAVDATKQRDLASQFEVKGFPTIKYFKNGEDQFKYTGGRTEKDLVDFMKDPKAPAPPPPAEPVWSASPSAIKHLTDETFASTLKDKDGALVIFYAPWCGHCKKAKPEFEAAADAWKDKNNVIYAAVDCTSNKDICNKLGVKGYPALKYFVKGELKSEYSSGRTEEMFTKFVTENASGKKENKKENKKANKKEEL